MPTVQIGLISKEIPSMRAIFAMFDPIIFPNTKPDASDDIAAREVNSSGAEVAMETMVSPTTTDGIPNFFANEEQKSLSKSPPLERKNSPIITQTISMKRKLAKEESLRLVPQKFSNSFKVNLRLIDNNS